MSALLDRPALRDQVHRLSVPAYHALGLAGIVPERTELLRGLVFDKMPKSSLHVWVVRALSRALAAQLPTSMDLRLEQPLTLADSEPEPDLCVVEARLDDYLDGHPRTALLVIEVCVSSEDRDREKAALYAEAGVLEYWIVHAEARRIDVLQGPRDGLYTLELAVVDGQSVQSLAVAGLVVAVTDVVPPA